MMSKRTLFRWLLAILMISAGITHFVKPLFYIRLIEDFLPEPTLLVYLSGALEIALGLGLLIPKSQRICGILLVHLFIILLPVHFHLAAIAQPIEGMPEYQWLHWVRFSLQFVLIAWALWCSKKETPA